MRPLLLTTVLLSQSAWVAADTCCIDEDIAAAFFQHVTLSREWPEAFPFELDAGSLEYIGSSVGHRGQHTSVAWKGELDPQSSLELVVDSLLAQDWLTMTQSKQTRAYFQRGFFPHRARVIANNQQFCRERDGTLSVQARRTDIGTVLILAHGANQGGQDCAGLIAAQRVQPNVRSGLMNYLPALALPEAVKVSPYTGGSSGGGNDEAHASISVESEVSAAEILGHFEPQMIEQQWTLDTRFHGNVASGHIWQRKVDDLNLTCILTAIDSGERLRLRMLVESM